MTTSPCTRAPGAAASPSRSRALAMIAASAFALTGCTTSTALTIPGADGSYADGNGADASTGPGGAAGGGQGGGGGGGGADAGTIGRPNDAGGTGAGNDAAGNGGSSPDAARGAAVPWFELQAEDPAHATTNAAILPPSRTKWDPTQMQAEAIGRQAVQLNAPGDYVEFTTTAPSNSIVVRYAIPDAPGGGGISATLGLYVNGTRVKSMNLTSHYAWSYDGSFIPSDNAGVATVESPSSGDPHTFFDEYNSGPGDGPENQPLLGEMPAGTKVRLQRDAQDSATFYVIDLVDFEEVAPPLPMPAGFKSVTDFGIQPNDGIDHADDIENALATAPAGLYFPPGEYIVRQYVKNAGDVALDNKGTEIAGAGMWYTRLLGKQAVFFCDLPSAPCNVHDLAVFGDVTARFQSADDMGQAFGGPQGSGTQLYNLWIEHEVNGIWVGSDPPYQTQPTSGLHVHDVRIRDIYADGINLVNGTSGSLVENVHLRNTGDEAASVWSIQWTKWVANQNYVSPGAISGPGLTQPDQGVAHGNHFQHISVQMPWRCSCFTAYGGYDNSWEDSTCEDVLAYPGILVDNEFSPYAFGGESTPTPTGNVLTTFQNVTVTRAGGEFYYEPPAPFPPWYHGALKLMMREGDVNDVLIENVDIVDPTDSGIEFWGFGTALAAQYGIKYDPAVLTAADNAKFTNVTLRNVTVSGAGTNGILFTNLASGSRGTIDFDGVSVTGSAQDPLSLGGAPASLVNKVGSANSGW